MNKIFKLIIVTLVITFNISLLNAACEEEQELAKEIKFNYTAISNAEELNIRLEIKNIFKDDFYFIVTNNINNKSAKYTYSDINEYGFIGFNSENVNKHITYTVKVYSETCSDNLLNTLSVTTPKYNPYSIKTICNGQADKIDECNPFYDVNVKNSDEFIKLVEDKIEENKFGIFKYIKKYYLYVLIPFLIIGLIYTIRILLFKRGNKNA